MGGETEQAPSSWTVDSLRDTILLLIGEKDARIVERDRRYEQRFNAQEEAIATAMTAYGTAVQLAATKHADEMAEIRRHFDTIMAERDVRYGERFEASQVAIQAALAEREKAIQAALLEREKAVQSAFIAQETAVRLAFVGLRDFYDTVLAERDARYEQRFAGAEKAVVIALATVDKEFHERIRQVKQETVVAMDAAEKAISKAEFATEKRFNSVNEFRSQQADIITTFARKSEVDARLLGLTEKIEGCQQSTLTLAAGSIPRAEFDRSHSDIMDRLATLEKTVADKIDAQAKAFEGRVALLQAQIAAVEAVTR